MLDEAFKSVEEDHHTVAIAGTVIDAFTNLHIFDAVVEILGSNLHIQAGVDGSFYLISDHLFWNRALLNT